VRVTLPEDPLWLTADHVTEKGPTLGAPYPPVPSSTLRFPVRPEPESATAIGTVWVPPTTAKGMTPLVIVGVVASMVNESTASRAGCEGEEGGGIGDDATPSPG
jgi:hypothetical protein